MKFLLAVAVSTAVIYLVHEDAPDVPRMAVGLVTFSIMCFALAQVTK